ncbi:MAG: NAD(P)-dependent dehydrogenase (short-subunit alcohol dehydrogenase family) [Gammaproteobacteria bacterium]|jgi:NAD(P)-dependent dehydrogenase (short-subunit alcohol dehydrogenase family)
MHVKNVLVIGASRGIGLELVHQFASKDWRVHATTRTVRAPGALGQVARRRPHL